MLKSLAGDVENELERLECRSKIDWKEVRKISKDMKIFITIMSHDI